MYVKLKNHCTYVELFSDYLKKKVFIGYVNN